MLEPLYRFRHEAYVEQLQWMPADPSGLLRDAFDDIAFNYAGLDDEGRVIGSIRVVPDAGAGLPLERCAPLNGFRGGKSLVELCRLVVHPEYRGSRLGALLMKAGFQRAVMEGATHIMLDTYVGEDEAIRLYRKLGFSEVTGQYRDEQLLHSLPVMTLAMDLVRSRDEWPRTRPGLHAFFTAEDDAISHA